LHGGKEKGVGWKGTKFLLWMVPVLWSFLRDLIWEEVSWGEMRINYLFGMANAYDRANFLRKAVSIYGEILKRDQSSIPVLLNLGGVYYRSGMFEKAIPFYEKVIRVNPKHYQGHYWLAMCYWKLQRYYAAINTLEDVIESLPTFKDALNLIGECYERIGDAGKAEHYYLKAIGAGPDRIIVHTRAGNGKEGDQAQLRH
jgi:tetratricopeptide (TPR) repeat protein